jgi:PAS domain S-box-containing protein
VLSRADHDRVVLDMKKKPFGAISLERSHSRREILRLFNRAIVDSPIPIIIHDENSRILQMSRGWTRFSGYTLEDIPTLTDWRQRAYGLLEPIQQFVDELKAAETIDDGEWIVTAKDGSKRIWHFMVTPLGLLEGRRILLATAVDVTESKRVEEALLKTQELLRQGVRVAALGIFDHDQINETLYWSREMIIICDLEPGEPATLAGFIERVHPDDREMIVRAIQRAHDPSGSGLYDAEHRIVRRDGCVSKRRHFFRAGRMSVMLCGPLAPYWISPIKNWLSNIANGSSHTNRNFARPQSRLTGSKMISCRPFPTSCEPP